jgi:glycosyltransferase involved in cell wall biosynthesis
MKRPSLSLCIPTYNRSDAVYALVQRALQCGDKDIELVVLDNGSTDDTLARLEEISDPRLSIHSNGSNRGVIFNVLHVMLKAKGRYCALLLDKDSVDPQQIGAFKAFLLRECVACGFCEYGPSTGRLPEILDAGQQALRHIGYTCHHPTGYFFDTQLLREIDITHRFGDFDYTGHFPLDFALAEVCLKGRGSIYHGSPFVPEQLTPTAKKSIGTNAAREDAFFSPKGRLKMAVNFSRHIDSLPIDNAKKRSLILDRFAQGFTASTTGYRRLLANELICHHYHIDPRHVGIWETIIAGRTFYRSFVLAFTNGAALRFASVSRTDIAIDFAYRVMRTVMRRLARPSA